MKRNFWLAPKQVAITTITSDSNEYAVKIMQDLQSKGIRCVLDIRNEKISYKIREHSTAKIPYIVTVGNKEMENSTISLRKLGSNETSLHKLNDFIQEVELLAAAPK